MKLGELEKRIKYVSFSHFKVNSPEVNHELSRLENLKSCFDIKARDKRTLYGGLAFDVSSKRLLKSAKTFLWTMSRPAIPDERCNDWLLEFNQAKFSLPSRWYWIQGRARRTSFNDGLQPVGYRSRRYNNCTRRVLYRQQSPGKRLMTKKVKMWQLSF